MNEGSLNYDLRKHKELVEILLKDQTTKKNILWATDDYSHLSPNLRAEKEINIHWIMDSTYEIIIPRVLKNQNVKQIRTKDRAEVFTPSYIINEQVSLIDREIKPLSLEEYVNTKWIEITCGEAPYVTTRYDVVTGKIIPVEDRVGFLDRKIQRISSEIDDEIHWYQNVLDSYKSSYAYEFHGDSLFVARENLLYNFIDFYEYKYRKLPSLDKIIEIANIISHNVFQMDGIRYEIPYTHKHLSMKKEFQISLFDNEMSELNSNTIYKRVEARLKDWNSLKTFKMQDLFLEKDGIGMFDVIIGNPPYHEMDNNSGTGSAKPLYHMFIEECIKLEPKYISLITPNVWFTGGKGLKPFRTKMLNDERFKRFTVFHTPKDIFDNVSLRGGVNFFLWMSNHKNNNQIIVENIANNEQVDCKKRTFKIGDLDVFIPDNVAVNIVEKLMEKGVVGKDIPQDRVLSHYISPRNPFGYSTTFKRTKKYSENPQMLKKPVKIYASRGEELYVENEEITKNRELIDTVKLVTPFANNIGTDLKDDNLNTIIIEKGAIVTETYLIVGLGIVKNKKEAENLSKYLRTKFVRFLISILKANQNGTRNTYSFVPIQDFRNNSVINWNLNIEDIDQQLFDHYGLSDNERDYINSSIREMK